LKKFNYSSIAEAYLELIKDKCLMKFKSNTTSSSRD
jgi:hypothetical protein